MIDKLIAEVAKDIDTGPTIYPDHGGLSLPSLDELRVWGFIVIVVVAVGAAVFVWWSRRR